MVSFDDFAYSRNFVIYSFPQNNAINFVISFNYFSQTVNILLKLFYLTLLYLCMDLKIICINLLKFCLK